MTNMYIGLVHYPVRNKNGQEITTSVTNLDIHDISRSARTYGFENYFVITPVKAQKQLLEKILGHWQQDQASAYNPDRHDALAKTLHIESVELAMDFIEKKEGKRPLLAVTGANFPQFDGDTNDLISKIKIDNAPLFIIFGTGWGLSASLVDRADFRLEPLYGIAKDGYNHLSVRSAVAIYLDRLSRAL